MSINDYKDPIVSQWNKYSIIVENEPHVVTSGMFALIGLPDIQQRVVINGYVEIGSKDEIKSSDEFKVDYTNGYVFMHSSKEAETINIAKYADRGVNLYPASRVWTKLTADGDIDETLEDITTKMDSALDLSNQIQQAEDVRISSETQRSSNEITRKSNEVARNSNEDVRVINENLRISDEGTRKLNEVTRKSNEDTRILSETQRDTDENIRIQSEIERVSSEDIRKSSEQTRVLGETTRELQESERQTNTTTVLNSLNDTNSNFSVWENYDNLKLYKPLNKVQYQGSSYINTLECTGVIPTNTANWQLVAAKGQDGVGGDMYKYIYDTNNNGIVDMSEDSLKLGGALAKDYASKTYVDSQVGLIIDTGVPKHVRYEYKMIGLIGQSKFDIPLETFDTNTDTISLFVNTTYWEETKYTKTNRVGDVLGYITLNTPLEEDKNIVIQINKNVPMGAEGSTSGSVLADGTVEDRKLTDKIIDDTIIPPVETNTGKLGSTLSWIGHMLKSITGKPSWKEKPTKNLEELNNDLSEHKAESASLTKKGHVQLQTVVSENETNAMTPKGLNDHLNNIQAHGATYVATPDRIILRDSAGRAKVVAPSASDDIARKKEVDDVQTNLNNHSETGVWTPSVKGESTPGTPTYSVRLGNYVRNGKLVYCDFDISFALSGGEGNITLSGLPFIPKNYGVGGTIIFATKDGVPIDISTISNLATMSDFRILDSKKVNIEKTTIGDRTIKLLGTLIYQIS